MERALLKSGIDIDPFVHCSRDPREPLTDLEFRRINKFGSNASQYSESLSRGADLHSVQHTRQRSKHLLRPDGRRLYVVATPAEGA